MIKLTILGSGTCVPYTKRNFPSYLLEINDKKILLDCGSGTLLQLEKIKHDFYKEIDYVFITHTHADHVGGLPALVQVLHYNTHVDRDRKKDLIVYGPLGFKEFYHQVIEGICGPLKDDSLFKIKVEELKEENLFNGFSVKTVQTPHYDRNNYSLKFIANNKEIAFSGDMGYNEIFSDFARTADLLIIECTLSEDENSEGHLNPKECFEIISKSNCKKVILTHLHKNEEENKKKLEYMKNRGIKDIYLADDLMEVELND